MKLQRTTADGSMLESHFCLILVLETTNITMNILILMPQKCETIEETIDIIDMLGNISEFDIDTFSKIHKRIVRVYTFSHDVIFIRKYAILQEKL